jgi:hypothetical protein
MTPAQQDGGPPAAAPSTRIRLPQESETALTTLRTPFGTALYLYARSVDSVHAGTTGQDYLTFRYAPDNLAFAVCDGVGQSFMGDLAARLLGDGLVDWLWEQDTAPPGADAFSERVREALDALAGDTADAVAAFRLPPGLPPLLRQALENQRAYGSESMFVAGRIALAGADPWIALCWLGDSPVAAIDIDGKLVDLGPKGHTSERWNAVTGVKGEVHTWVGGAENVARVAGYTDGLAVDGVPTDADLARLLGRWSGDPPADDASLFDLRLAPSPETTGQDEAPDPETLRVPGFEPDESRPIVVAGEPRTPVTRVEPIEAGDQDTAVEGWRPLGEGEKEQAPVTEPAASLPKLDPGDIAQQGMELLSSLASSGGGAPPLSAQQQVQMWQQAALLGLTSAALAMLMVERLVHPSDQAEKDAGGKDADES